jgi:hypothetical protein
MFNSEKEMGGSQCFCLSERLERKAEKVVPHIHMKSDATVACTPSIIEIANMICI